MGRLPSLALLLWLALLAGCVRSDFNLATQRQEYSFTSTDKEVEIGRKLARRVERELTLVPDEAMQQRVRAIGGRLAAVCDRRELVYSFEAVKDDDVNAFSLPGGYIFVNEGLVKKVGSDDELAAVLAHEIGHVAARHSIKRYETALATQLAQLATIAVARQGQAARGLSVVMQATQLAYARQDELDADRLAVRYMREAGYDPSAALSFLNRLHGLDQSKLRYMPRGVVRPQYGMTHPFIPERIRAVKEALYGVADYIDYLNSSE